MQNLELSNYESKNILKSKTLVSDVGIQSKIGHDLINKTSSLEKKAIKPENFFTGQKKYEEITIMKGYIFQNKYDRIYYIKISSNPLKEIKSQKISSEDTLKEQILSEKKTIPKANILIIHGYGDSARLVNLAINLSKKTNINNIVHLFDINGFGFSGGKRFNATVEDIFENFSSMLNLMSKKIPLICYAEGYGALFLMHFQILYNINIAGMVIVSPWIDIPKSASLENFYLKYFFVKVLGHIFDVF